MQLKLVPRALRPSIERLCALPFVRFAVAFLAQLGVDDISGLGAEMAYRFLFAIFPFLIFLAAVVGFISARVGYVNLFSLVMTAMHEVVPPEIDAVLGDWVSGVLSTQSPGLLTLGALGALWGGSGGIGTLIKGLNRAYQVGDDRAFWQTQLLGLSTTIVLTGIMIVGISLYTYGHDMGQAVADALGLGQTFVTLWERTRAVGVDLGLILMLLVMYRQLPNLYVRWRDAVPGAVVAALGWILLTSGFSFYIDHFGSYDRTFGSLGAAVVLMAWMYMVGVILLFGGELNAALARRGTPTATPEDEA